MIAESAIATSAIALASASTVDDSSVYTVSLPLAVAVCDELVFEVGGKTVFWSAVVEIAGEDVSSRLRGQVSIKAGEDSARTASLELIPSSVEQMLDFEGANVTIDIALRTSTSYASYRRFTGTVEQIGAFDPATRRVTLECRDGYQERPKACTTAAEVQALLGGKAAVCEAIVEWSDTAPDPASYFSGLQETLLGACAIDSSGVWQVIDWAIGVPAATFAAGDLIDGTLNVQWAAKADLPASIVATMTLRYNRLHAVALDLSWEGLDYTRIGLDGCSWPTRSAVEDCLNGLSGWYVQDGITYGMLATGTYPLIHDGTTSYMVVSETVAASCCTSMSSTMYTRWYQEIDRAYTVTIDLGGTSDRDESITASIASEFEASDWESADSSDSTTEIYSANAPGSGEDTDGDGVVDSEETAYQALPSPYPDDNAALDYCPDIDPAEAVAHIAAKALRTAAAGLRQRTVSFDKVVDPRWEIGAVLGAAADGVSAIGQLVEFEETLDHDSGECIGTYTLAVPAGNGTTTEFSITSIPALSNSVAHAFTAPTLTNFVGASSETPADPDEDTICGFLCNVSNMADMYDSEAPVYESQFRVVMPEIPEDVRDPADEAVDVTMTWSIAAGTLAIEFEE